MHKWLVVLVVAGISYGASISASSAQVGSVDMTSRELVETLSFSGQFDVPYSTRAWSIQIEAYPAFVR